MKLKGLFTLAALLTSSLAGAADVGDLKDKYYAGLNFGAGYGGGFSARPSIVLGYHYEKSSKFELEINSNIQSLKSIGAGLMVNYRYYPDLDIDPVTLYVSGGLGGYLQIIPFGIAGGSTGGDADKPTELASPAMYADEAAGGSSIVDKILNTVMYKLKVGVDYAFTPQIIGAVGVMAGSSLKSVIGLKIPDAVLELGIRYNF